ncbi:MAG: acyclic terpene utilization AtuA family protein, partial [Proteobacteria bacterium]|nr:acyclic terpene utilization AtuA family protein [Pseudomonadota bacterium]
MTTKVLVPTGALGISFDREAFRRAIAAGPDIIAVDGGSTDSGPYALGTGTSKYSRAGTKAEWRELMIGRAKAGVPLVIGTSGTCGTDSTVDWMYEITQEIAKELGQTVKVARLYSSQPVARVRAAMAEGRVKELYPAPEVSAETLGQMSNIVALAGAEQVQEALATGADIVIAGRTTDTAIISALPLQRGEHAGGAWHGAKIGECGALCSTNPTSGVIMVHFDVEGFTVEPFAKGAVCTPHSVSAHMLYENSDPFILYEPGGHLDVTGATYREAGDGRVRVTGSKWVPGTYTVKLEGARLAGYQTSIMAVLRDGHYVAHAQAWVDKLTAFLKEQIKTRMGLGPDDYSLEFRLIGVNSVLGGMENRTGAPVEVGVLGLITARTAEDAAEIGKIANPWVLHYPLTENEELPTFAFPYSPAQSERGAFYEFALNHVMQLDRPMDAFRIEVSEIGAA